MSRSALATVSVPASTSNYTQGRRGYKVCKITVHHMAGKLTAKQCGNIFANPNRNASSNYGIGYDGDIGCYVDEENRAWTSSNRENDCQAITIEVANSSNGHPWPISDASWNSLVNLCVDICRRYGFRLTYDGTKNGSLTRHDMFANTNCPGPSLGARFPELAETVNKILDGGKAPAQNNNNNNTNNNQNAGYTVRVTANVLNVRSGPGTNYGINTQIKDKGIYTIVEENNGWGRLKSGAGWISLAYTTKNTTSSNNSSSNSNNSSSSGYVLGLYVVNTSSGLNVRSGPGTNYGIKKTYPNGTRFDTYEINGEWARTPSGWVCLKYCKLVRKY